MEKARINIEVIDDGEAIRDSAVLEGTSYLLMLGLISAIKRIEKSLPLKHRNNFRLGILRMLLEED